MKYQVGDLFVNLEPKEGIYRGFIIEADELNDSYFITWFTPIKTSYTIGTNSVNISVHIYAKHWQYYPVKTC